ncbi:hypothetical protein ACCD01_20470, partial [Telluria sp. Tellsp99]
MGAIRTLPASAQPRGAASIQRLLAPLAPWALPVFLIVAWQAASRTGLLSTRILPEPLAVAKAFGDLAVSGELWTHLRVSLWRAAAGFGLGAALGGVLALMTPTAPAVLPFALLLTSTLLPRSQT